MTLFEEELRELLNKHSMENGSNTPDFILAEYLVNCLTLFEKINNDRQKWYNVYLEPGYNSRME